MKRSPLTLDHMAVIIQKLDAVGMHLSEFSFPNLYLFRNTHEYELIETTQGIFISGLSSDKKRYLMPLMNPVQAEEGCFDELKSLLLEGEWDFIFPIPEEWLDCFGEDEFIRNYSPNDSDYLFYTEKFKTYPGKKMHKKRNLLNQFLRSYDALFVPMTDETVDDAKVLLELWQHTSPQEIAASDYYQCSEALNLWKDLGLTGAMAYADNKPAGFLLGEALNDDTFTIHFAKADIHFKGVYQFLFSRFAADFCPHSEFLNLEQDLGSAGLRKTKMSYRPDLIAHKYRISLKT